MNDEEKVIQASIWLQPAKVTLHFCMVCRNNLHFKVEGRPKQILFGIDASQTQDDGYRPLKFPIRVRCDGRSQIHGRCPMEWIVQGYIEDDASAKVF